MPDANAHPKKRFFIDMFTRDIPLHDCVLDLIDNCFDGLARTGHLEMHTISNDIFRKKKTNFSPRRPKPWIKVEFDGSHFKISDNCGGIDYAYALKDVFNFGHSTKRSKEYLGVYGVGMKRALFKMGEEFVIESSTVRNGFRCHLNVPKWMDKDEKMSDWTIPLTATKAAKSPDKAGTVILIKPLKPDVKAILSSPQFEDMLVKAIGKVYAFLVGTRVHISVNGTEVHPFQIPLSEPKQGEASYEEFQWDGVSVRLLATLASVPKKENSGWYVACNGRLVLVADTTSATGWGVSPTPMWVPKYTAFIGIVFFESKNGLALPWTTTKRDVNRESSVYRKAISRMAVLARPILSFCNKKYPGDQDVEPVEREIAKQVKPVNVSDLVSTKPSTFEIRIPKRETVKTVIRVQYDAKIADINAIRKHLRKPSMGAARIGEHTLQYFLRHEGLK